MHRFYLPPAQCGGTLLTLTGAEAHHASAVLRLRNGDKIAILDGEGREFFGAVEMVERKSVTVTVEKMESSPKPACRVTLIQAIPKGKLIETIIQKATELGVARVIPLLSERVAMQVDEEGAQQKEEKWRQTAIEAIKQCGQRWLPQVEAPVTLPVLLARAEKFDLALVGSLQSGAQHPRAYFQGPLATLALWIGPEGDFSPAELQAIVASGAKPTTFGPLVLRSDTAAIYAMAMVSYETNWSHCDKNA